MDLLDFYFAYGADLDLVRLRERAGDVKFASPARLAGYRLAFFDHDPVWDSGVETLVKDDLAETWGALYHLRPVEWERLDACMGATPDGTGACFHFPVEVTSSTGEISLVRTYMRSTRGEPRPPSREYLAYLMAGAQARGLPEAYLAAWRALPTSPARYPVPRQDPNHRRRLHVI